MPLFCGRARFRISLHVAALVVLSMSAVWPYLIDDPHSAPRRKAAWLWPVVAILPFLFAGCGGQKTYPSRPITLICPWAVGGGTDRVARQVAMHLEQDLGVPEGSEDEMGDLLQRGGFTSPRQDRIPPMALPIVLACLLGFSALGIVGRKLCEEVSEPIDFSAAARRPALHYFLLIVLAAVAFLYATPVAGFIVTATAILFVLLWAFGSRWRTSALVAAGMSLGVYELFGHLLHVPLPQGWLGW